jgi:hypothetical protein
VARYSRAEPQVSCVFPLLSHSDDRGAIFSAKVDSAWSDLILNSLALPMNAPSRAVLLAVVIPRWCLFHTLSADPALRCLRGRRVKLIGIAQLYRGEPEIESLSTDLLALE